MVKIRQIAMPIAAKIPKWATGAISVKEKDNNPTMVVRLVMIIGSPECSKVRVIALIRPTLFWYLKKTTIK